MQVMHREGNNRPRGGAAWKANEAPMTGSLKLLCWREEALGAAAAQRMLGQSGSRMRSTHRIIVQCAVAMFTLDIRKC